MSWSIIPADTRFDFLSRARLFVAISLLVIGAGVVAILLKGLNLGIDFKGGTLVQIQTQEEVPLQAVREALSSVDLGGAVIQRYGSPRDLLIRAEAGGEEVGKRVKGALVERFGEEGVEVERLEQVGPQIGADLRKKAVLAIAYALGMVVIYITIRFEFKYAVGAIVALIHDVSITLGAFAVTGLEIDLPTVAAFLTIVGYSLNDTIVVFDRIRENHRENVQLPVRQVIDRSINETLSRTILTSGTTLVVVVALFFLGGEVIHDFAFALVVGVIVGTYSSIFIASPLVAVWDRLVHRDEEIEDGSVTP
ncbi:MAG: protein translocase subunit SecF [Nitrospirota bacterium]|jgi:preprotein translocase subunit SecF